MIHDSINAVYFKRSVVKLFYFTNYYQTDKIVPVIASFPVVLGRLLKFTVNWLWNKEHVWFYFSATLVQMAEIAALGS